jgi:hypothetical protein
MGWVRPNWRSVSMHEQGTEHSGYHHGATSCGRRRKRPRLPTGAGEAASNGSRRVVDGVVCGHSTWAERPP